MKVTIPWDIAAAREAEAAGKQLSGFQIQAHDENDGEAVSRAHGPLNIICATGIYAPPRDRMKKSLKGKEVASTGEEGEEKLPTWLPNWSQSSPSLSIDDLSYNRFKVGGDSDGWCWYTLDNKTLFINECAITTLAHMSSLLDSHKPTSIDLVKTFTKWHDFAEKVTRKAAEWDPGVFWKTLAFDSYLNRWSTEAP